MAQRSTTLAPVMERTGQPIGLRNGLPLECSPTTELDAELSAAFLATADEELAAVIAFNERLVLTKGDVARSFMASPTSEHSGILSHVGVSRVVLDLPLGGPVLATRSVIRTAGQMAGVILRISKDDLLEPLPNDPCASSSIFPGASSIARRVRAQLANQCNDFNNVLIWGPAGVGKTYAANEILASRPPRTAVVMDARESTGEAWLDGIEGAATTSRSIVLKHLDEVHSPIIDDLVTSISAWCSQVRFVATANDVRKISPPLVSLFPSAVRMPALAERLEDLADVAAAILERIDGPARRLSASARQLLWTYEWPGNVAELASVLVASADSSPSNVIEDGFIRLPTKCASGAHSANRGMLEDAERSVLVEVLRRASGNKVVAAHMLGIARSTLYRKLHSFGINEI